MTQIKSIKGIVEKLVKRKPLGDYPYYPIEEVLNTDLDPNECACVDVEKATKALCDILEKEGILPNEQFNLGGSAWVIAKALATSNCLKWIEGDSPKEQE